MNQLNQWVSVGRGLCAAIIASCMAMTVGCGAEADYAAEDEFESIGVVEQELGELACTDVSCPSTGCGKVSIPSDANCQNDYYATSSSTSYGSDSCPSQFVAKPSSYPANGRKMSLYVGWGDTPLTQANCSSARLEGALYRQELGAEILQGRAKWHGVWKPWGCSFELDSGYTVPYWTKSVYTSYVYASGTAKLSGVKKKVQVGFEIGDTCVR